MLNHKLRRCWLAAHVVLVSLVLFGLVSERDTPRAMAGNGVPAAVLLRDQVDDPATAAVETDRVRSDGIWRNLPNPLPGYTQVHYLGGEDCVGCAGFLGTDDFFLRTVMPDCSPSQQRTITLDFSDAIERTPDDSGSDACHVDDARGQSGELNICGANALPDVRITSDKLFSSSALTQGAPLPMVLNLVRSFETNAFRLRFGRLKVILDPNGNPNVRVVMGETPEGEPVTAELIKEYVEKGRVKERSLGRYRMRFKMTVMRFP